MINAKLLLEHTRDLNVLYVEDDEILLDTTTELLKNYFHYIDTAVDGEDGFTKYLEYQNRHNKYYDLILSDINMPKLNGIEMSQQIMKHNPLQAIIITTAHNEPEYILDAIRIGVNGFISKPLKSEDFLKTLYKVSQSISDHNFFLNHVEVIEDLNMKLEEKNRVLERTNKELLAKNSELEKSSRVLDTMVEKVQSTHKESTDSQNVLSTNDQKYIQEQIENLINDDLYELIELHNEIDLHIINILNNKEKNLTIILSKLSNLFKRYSAVLKYYSFFNELSTSMSTFSIALKNTPLPNNSQMVENIFILVEGFTYVLGKWQTDLSTSDITKINSLDASMISDMNTIINMWEQKEEEVSQEDIDDIFDF